MRNQRGYVVSTFVILKPHYIKQADKASLCLKGHNPQGTAAVSVQTCGDYKRVWQSALALLHQAHWLGCTTYCHHLPPPPFHTSSWESAAENLGSVRARFMQGMVTEPLFQKGNIQTPSPITTEKSVYTEFPDKSIKCFSSKQKTVCATLSYWQLQH